MDRLRTGLARCLLVGDKFQVFPLGVDRLLAIQRCMDRLFTAGKCQRSFASAGRIYDHKLDRRAAVVLCSQAKWCTSLNLSSASLTRSEMIAFSDEELS